MPDGADHDARRRHLVAADRHAASRCGSSASTSCECVRRRALTPRTGVDEGVRVVEVLEAMQRSLERGGETISLAAAAR